MNKLVLAETQGNNFVRSLLDALEAEFAVCPLEAIQAGERKGSTALILSESQFVALCEAAGSRRCEFGELVSAFSDVLVYPFSGSAQAVSALGRVVGAKISVSPMSNGANSDYLVNGTREMCGPFASVRVQGVNSTQDVALRFRDSTSKIDAVVMGGAGSLLAKFELTGLNLFVASSTAVFDSSAEHQRNLDVRESFSGLVPLLFFLRHCRINLPQSPFPWANWIIDDPNLTPRYGFLDIRELAKSVQETRAAASIAFIPWNHRRTDKDVVGLFKQGWPQLSICVHGCDHTVSEFSTRTASAAMPLVDLAYRRMAQLERETSLGFDRVMVFPQGRFSGEAMRALRASPMLSAVNTELVDCQTGAGVKGHELLRPAIMSFGGFPLFMRRRAEEASADFALDLLLGKPCLIVTHHQFFEDGLKPLRAAVDRLNALQPDMVWTNLERGILSTYSLCSSSSSPAVRLYSACTTVQPQMDETISFTRFETDPEVVEVFVNGTQLPCSRLARGIQFTAKGPGKEAMTVEARSSIREPSLQAIQSRKYRLKVSARRYLSEVRDNYLCRFPRLTERAASVQQLLHRVR
jgi:hypothetical protein